MTTTPRLTLAEELLLVALDDATGSVISLPTMALELGLSAALIAELTLAGRLDSDAKRLFVISKDPAGDPLLDDTLAEIAAETEPLPTDAWLRRISEAGPELRERITQRLVQRGVLKAVEKRLLWVFKARVYPPTSGIEEREVKSRVMTLLNNEEIPAPRDALLIGLLRATCIFDSLLSDLEHERLRTRIDQISDLEEIGRSLNKTVGELQLALASAYLGPM